MSQFKKAVKHVHGETLNIRMPSNHLLMEVLRTFSYRNVSPYTGNVLKFDDNNNINQHNF